MRKCVYLKDSTGNTTPDGRDVYKCEIHNQCTVKGDNSPFASCQVCIDKLSLRHKDLAAKFRDPLVVLDSTRSRTTALRNLLKGGVSFLVCGGPSAKKLPLDSFTKRGVWSLAVNNMAGYCHTEAFVCSDPPKKFCDGIWTDPTIMKFVPTPKLAKSRSSLRRKTGERIVDGKCVPEFESLEIDNKTMRVLDCPNVWGFGRRAWMEPDTTFFTDDHAAWGNLRAGVNRTNQPKTVNTMLLGLRLLYYLGSRRIYLVGVDFNMLPTDDVLANYAFSEDRDSGAISSNNNQYSIVNKWLCNMEKDGVFSKFGLEIYNCNPISGLRAFPYVSFDDAIQDAQKHLPSYPYDLRGWYYHPKKEEAK